jgi:diguanylate cyclase (GGDEF)-like protein/PAS domain S-box-containing protein
MSDSGGLQHIFIVEFDDSKNTIILNNQVYAIGRHSSNSIVIRHSTISRYHCTILPVKYKDKNQQEIFWIIDGDLKGNRSYNGLFFNGEKCLSHELKPGDIIFLGGKEVKATYDIIPQKAGSVAISPAYITSAHLEDTLNSQTTLLDGDSNHSLIAVHEDLDKLMAEILWRLTTQREISNYPIVEINLAGEITYLNQAAQENLANLEREQNQHLLVNNLVEEVLKQPGNFAVREIKFEGEKFTQYSHYLPQEECIRSYLFDFSEREQIGQALRESEELYRAVVRQISEGIILVEPGNKQILEANSAYCSLLGYSSEEILGLKIYDLVAVEPEIIDSIIRRIVQDRLDLTQESIHRRKDGSLVNVEVSVSIVCYSAKEVICYAVRDITERKRSEEMLRYQACHDLLTDLGNRSLFNEQLHKAIANAQRYNHNFAIMFLDLDRFKNINDTLGHDIGDKLLQSLAQRLKSCLRAGDTLARWGGDEFTLLLSQINQPGDAAQVATKILTALKQPFPILEYQLNLNLSIGIALYPQDGKTPETLLKNADIALYRIKEEGGGNYQYYNSALNPHDEREELLILENSLHHALEKQQFLLLYQPQINIKTGKVTAMEALIRWQHPQLGEISPDKFIPLAEANGLIIPIGEWVLYHACRQNRLWQNAGLSPIKIAVNLSARQFRQDNIANIVEKILEKTGLEPNYLELEITETSIIQNYDYAGKILTDLNSLGVQISMDDFGTGYYCLDYLKKFPFQKIKIDRCFVRDLQNNPQDLAIISAVVTLGNGFELQVVVEGVETKQQLELLQSLQSEQMQGYLFSPPLNVEQATHFLSNPVEYLRDMG